nr:hypothetical protein [Tanacetum cinerariifolium]
KSSPELMTCLLFQSSCEKEHLKALQALLSCPTSSTSTEKPTRDSVSCNSVQRAKVLITTKGSL